MSKHQKLLDRFKEEPKDFTLKELVRLFTGLGYEQSIGGKTGGSRRRFIHKSAPRIFLHRPHGEDELKSYIIRAVKEKLQEGGLL